ncbi:hypothetical protein TNCV_1710631 [Trichonephila clavipes]|nr:hypothetical protein TNCV_1710631 [Trichonephila clavipes]
MVTERYLFATLAICVAFNFAIADEDKKEETDDAQPFSAQLNGTLAAADGAKDKMEDDVLKGYTSAGKELTEEGVKKAQSFAEDTENSFSAGMGKIVEVGSKIKEAFGDAVLNAKDKFETVASTIAGHVKSAVGTFSKLLG